MNKLRNIFMFLLVSMPIVVYSAENNQISGLPSIVGNVVRLTCVYQGLKLMQNRCLAPDANFLTHFFLAVNNATLSTIITFPQLPAKIKIPMCIVSALATLAAVDHEIYKAKLCTLITQSHLKPSGKIFDIDTDKDECVICHDTIKEALSRKVSRLPSTYDLYIFKSLCCQNGDHLMCGPCFVTHFFHANKVECPICRQVCPDYEIINAQKIDSKGLLVDWLVQNRTFRIVQS